MGNGSGVSLIIGPAKVYDNFLPTIIAQKLLDIVLSEEFPWYYNHCILTDDIQSGYQFTHTITRNGEVNSRWSQLIDPFVSRLGNPLVDRAKFNLNHPESEHRRSGFHIDSINQTTAVYYMNTTNGGTEFEDGTFISGIGNRIAIFDSNIRHSGVSHTGNCSRIVLNLNYVFSASDDDTFS